jgi:hypothetical protein
VSQQPRPAIAVGQTWRSKADGVANIKIRAKTVNTEQWVVRENQALYPAGVYEATSSPTRVTVSGRYGGSPLKTIR